MNIIEELKKLKSEFKKNKISFIKKLATGLGIAVLGGLFGAWGGADGTSKAWRRVGLTVLYTLYALLNLRNPWALSVICVFGPLTMGYGVPCSISGDKGSTLGKFWYHIFQLYKEKTRLLYTDIATRSTVASIIILSVIVAPILKGTWANYFLYSCPILCVFAFVSWRNLKTFKFLDRDLSWSEFITWSITTFSIIKIIG